MVGVSVDDVMTDYYKMTRSAGVAIPPVIGRMRKPPRDINAVPWIIGAVVALLVAAVAYWWFVMRSPDSTPESQPASASTAILQPFAERPVEVEADAGLDDVEEESGTPEEAVTVESAAAETGSVNADTQLQPQEPASSIVESVVPQVSIGITYSGDCWTEVSDASGSRLFYDLGTAGRVISLSGAAPIRVIFGDADNVSMTVDGQDFSIPGSARRGRLARLTINAR